MTTCVTIAELKKIKACPEGLVLLRKNLPYKVKLSTPIPAWEAAQAVPLQEALWVLDNHPGLLFQRRIFSVWCARSVLKYTDDWRVVNCVNVAERYAYGQATENQLKMVAEEAVRAAKEAVRAAAWAAAWAVEAAWAAAWERGSIGIHLHHRAFETVEMAVAISAHINRAAHAYAFLLRAAVHRFSQL